MSAKSPFVLHSVPDIPPSSVVVQDVAALEAEVAQLRHALQSRATIEQAKGMLMLRNDITEARAFGLLVRWASHHGVELGALSDTVVGSKDHALALLERGRLPCHGSPAADHPGELLPPRVDPNHVGHPCVFEPPRH